MRFKYIIIPIFFLYFIAGCGLKQQVKGEYYLNAGKYKEGISSFEKEIQKNPDQPNALAGRKQVENCRDQCLWFKWNQRPCGGRGSVRTSKRFV